MARGKRRDSKPGEGQYEDGWIIDYGHVLRRPQPFDDVELDPETLEQIAAVVAAMTAELNEEIARLAAEERPQLNVLPETRRLGTGAGFPTTEARSSIESPEAFTAPERFEPWDVRLGLPV